jgi:hypothetical protein
MSGHGRDLEYMAGCVAGRVARRIASPDRAGAIAEFSHTGRPPHGYAVALSCAWHARSSRRSRPAASVATA